jgi:AcrR family transcriptional regulator
LRSQRGAAAVIEREAPREDADPSEAPGAPYDKLKPGPGREAADVADHQRTRIQSALIELVAERGYAATTVRALAARASVSTRTFYQHYSSKEECLLRTHGLVVRRLLKRLVSAAAGRDAQEARAQRLIETLMYEWACDPAAARLMLIDVYTAGPSAVAQGRRSVRMIEVVVGESLNRTAERAGVPAWLAEGIVAGLVGVVRPRLLAGEEKQLRDLSDCLAQWAISCCNPPSAQLEEFSSRPPLDARGSRRSPTGSIGRDGREDVMEATGDRALLLSAVSKLAELDGCERPTSKKVLAAAGLPRRSFYANFGSVEDCLVAAGELRAGEAIAKAREAADKGLTTGESVHLAMSTLCARIAEDIVFANLCFGGIAATGPQSIRCHEQLMAQLVDLGRGLGLDGGLTEVAIEASTSAILILLENEVSTSRSRQLPDRATRFTYMLLAPAAGVPTTFETLQAKH